MSELTIGDAAAETGSSPSTLRYYEKVGLLRPGRSAAGYRVYDDLGLSRIRFIMRAKQLGLTLDEIAELLPLWDGDQCAPVAEHLRTQVEAKLGAARAHMAELTEFVAELEGARARLGEPAPPGPCDDGCLCQSTPGGHPSPEAIACTLDAHDVPERLAEWRALVAETTAREDIDGGRRLRFPPDPALADRIARLSIAEQTCCSFFDFTVRLTGQETWLEVRAPADAEPLVDALVGSAMS